MLHFMFTREVDENSEAGCTHELSALLFDALSIDFKQHFYTRSKGEGWMEILIQTIHQTIHYMFWMWENLRENLQIPSSYRPLVMCEWALGAAVGGCPIGKGRNLSRIIIPHLRRGIAAHMLLTTQHCQMLH